MFAFKKPNTCEEGGAHLRISFWHLLMKLKNKLLKKLLKWANKNKIILIFTMLHFLKKYKEKHLQISLSKSQWYDLQFLRYRAKYNNFNIYDVEFFLKKIKKNASRYHYQNLNDIIYSSWDIEQNILKLVILGHFLPFYPP